MKIYIKPQTSFDWFLTKNRTSSQLLLDVNEHITQLHEWRAQFSVPSEVLLFDTFHYLMKTI